MSFSWFCVFHYRWGKGCSYYKVNMQSMHQSSQRGLLAISMCHMSLKVYPHAPSNPWYSAHVSKELLISWSICLYLSYEDRMGLKNARNLIGARLVMWPSINVYEDHLKKPAKSHFSSTSARIQTLRNGGIWLDPKSISSSQKLICLPFSTSTQELWW